MKENKFLNLGWKEFLFISTVFTFFFPWSILFCLIYLGYEDTKLLVKALLDDWVKTMIGVIVGITLFILLVIYFLVHFF